MYFQEYAFFVRWSDLEYVDSHKAEKPKSKDETPSGVDRDEGWCCLMEDFFEKLALELPFLVLADDLVQRSGPVHTLQSLADGLLFSKQDIVESVLVTARGWIDGDQNAPLNVRVCLARP